RRRDHDGRIRGVARCQRPCCREPVLRRPHASLEILGGHRGAGAARARRAAGAASPAADAIVIATALHRRTERARWSASLRTERRDRLSAHLGVGLALQKTLLPLQTPPIAS